MKAIVNVDKNWGIGANNELLNPIPADLKLFKALTINNIVVMGLTTFLSLPGQKALPQRTNIVLTTDPNWSAPDVIVCHSIDEVLQKSIVLPGEVFIAGGASIYEQFLPYCEYAYVTKVNTEKPADRFFPNLDKIHGWHPWIKGKKQRYEDTSFRFTVYKNEEVKSYNEQH